YPDYAMNFLGHIQLPSTHQGGLFLAGLILLIGFPLGTWVFGTILGLPIGFISSQIRGLTSPRIPIPWGAAFIWITVGVVLTLLSLLLFSSLLSLLFALLGGFTIGTISTKVKPS